MILAKIFHLEGTIMAIHLFMLLYTNGQMFLSRVTKKIVLIPESESILLFYSRAFTVLLQYQGLANVSVDLNMQVFQYYAYAQQLKQIAGISKSV